MMLAVRSGGEAKTAYSNVRANNRCVTEVASSLFEYYLESVACMSPLNQHTPIAIPC